jgi:malate/lactate dehydrogenase
MMRVVKVTILGGAGGVGSSVAFNLLLGGGSHDVVLVDRREDAAAAHVLDLEQVLEQRPSSSVRVGGEDDVRDADVVVLATGAPLRPNVSRLVYLEEHAPVAARVAKLLGAGWPGILVVVTNPVDPLCTFLQRRTGLDRRRVLGYTLNDSLRLRTGVARALGCAPGAVEAWVLGEHGDTSVPLWDRVRLDGKPVELGPEQRAAAEEFVRAWYVRSVTLDPGRSSTWTSGLGVARMVAALAEADVSVWPASVVLQGEYGIDGVSVGVPVTLGPGGAERIHEWELAPAELQGLRRSAEHVRVLTARLEAAAKARS